MCLYNVCARILSIYDTSNTEMWFCLCLTDPCFIIFCRLDATGLRLLNAFLTRQKASARASTLTLKRSTSWMMWWLSIVKTEVRKLEVHLLLLWSIMMLSVIVVKNEKVMSSTFLLFMLFVLRGMNVLGIVRW